MQELAQFMETGEETVGFSPSFQATLRDGDGTRYQMKFSNSTNRARRYIGYDPDNSDILR